MKYTLTIVLITCAVYFLLSSLSFFIPNETVFQLGFSASNWIGVITYPFLHISLLHLLNNMLLLLAVGLVVEEKLDWKNYYAIYLLSGIFAGIVFLMLSPNIVLVGASAAIAGFVIPACLIDFRKTIAYLILFSIVSAVATPIVQSLELSVYTSSHEQAIELLNAYNQTVQQKAQIVDNMSILSDKFKKGEINTTQYDQSRHELITQFQNLTEQQQTVSEKLNETAGTVLNLEEGITREQTSKTSVIVHLVGSVAGLFYLTLFRRDIIWNSGYQVSRLERWLRRRPRKSRKRT